MATEQFSKRLRRLLIGTPRLKWAVRQMERSGLNALLDSRPAGAIPPSDFDLWTLWGLIRSSRPDYVVEFGVGCSTYVIAEALHRNNRGILHSVDANDRWIAEVEDQLPAHLRERIRLHSSSLTKMQIEGEPCHAYTTVPQIPIDFIYLDGPDTRDVPDWTSKPMAADPILLEARFRPGFQMMVDKRPTNVAFLRRRLSRNYLIKSDDIFRNTLFSLKE